VKLFYGWVIVAVGIVVTCVGFGAMLTLSIFLQPVASAMGWSRTGIATAAMLNFFCMGLGAVRRPSAWEPWPSRSRSGRPAR
jgi:Na+-transporting NADH:ubiquinone oxidoreductase subunit NqrD